MLLLLLLLLATTAASVVGYGLLLLVPISFLWYIEYSFTHHAGIVINPIPSFKVLFVCPSKSSLEGLFVYATTYPARVDQIDHF